MHIKLISMVVFFCFFLIFYIFCLVFFQVHWQLQRWDPGQCLCRVLPGAGLRRHLPLQTDLTQALHQAFRPLKLPWSPRAKTGQKRLFLALKSQNLKKVYKINEKNQTILIGNILSMHQSWVENVGEARPLKKVPSPCLIPNAFSGNAGLFLISAG